MEPRRIYLFADPGRLAGFDSDTALAQARSELERRHADIDLRDVELAAPDCVLVALLLPPGVHDEDVEEVLRDVLGLGPGPSQRGPDTRTIGAVSPTQTRACTGCGYTGGRHAPDCKYRKR